MIGTALAIYSMANAFVKQIQAGQAAEQAQRKLNLRKQELDLDFKKNYNEDFMNMAPVKSAMNLLMQRYIENAKKVGQGNVISGASDEKAVAQAEEMQKPYVGAITNFAQYGMNRQDLLRREYNQNKNVLFGLDYGAEREKAGNLMNAAGNSFNALGSIGMASAYGGFDKPELWLRDLLAGKQAKVLQGATKLPMGNVKGPKILPNIDTTTLRR